MSCGTMRNSSWVKSMSVLSIQFPARTMTRATPASFGTNVSVASCTCVADCRIETNSPMPSVTARMGAASFTVTRIAIHAMWSTCVSVMRVSRSRSLTETVEERVHDEVPAVDHHEQQQLERERDDHGREHEHAHGRQ